MEVFRLMKRKLSLLLVFILLTGVLAGCGGGDVSDDPSPQDEVEIAYYAYNSEPILNWDPSVMFSNGIIVLNNIYETLLRFDPKTKEFDYLLAEDYSVSEDGLTWTFNLREGVKFHDGTEMTAEDVKFSIDRTMELGKGASYIWAAVSEIIAVDDYTVEFKLSYPSPLDLVASSPYAAFIMSKDAVENAEENWFENANEAGSGPYMLESAAMGDEVIMTTFEDYWNGWEGDHFDKVIIKKTSETSSRRQMIEKGDADITQSLPSEDVEALKETDGVEIVVEPSFTNLIGFFNTEKQPLDNPKVRQALSYAFPYQDVVDYAVGGYAKQSIGVIPFGHWGHSDDLFQYTKDLDKAKELLEEAGIEDGELKLLLTYMSGDESEKKSAELYKAELSKIGVELEIRAMPWETQWEMAMNEDPAERQDIFIMYWWPDTSSPYSWLYSLYHSEEEILFNMSYYSNEEFDTIIDNAAEISGTDIEKAEEEFIKAQEILIEDSPSIFMYDKEEVWAINSTFKGFEYNPSYPLVVFFYDTYRSK